MVNITGTRSKYFAVADRDGATHVVDASKGQVVHSLWTACDTAGSVAVTRNGALLATGHCEEHGVSLYRNDGARVWHREDLAGVNTVSFGAGESILAVEGISLHSADDWACVLDAASGETLRQFKATSSLRADPDGDALLADGNSGLLLLHGSKTIRLGKKTPSLGACAFGDGKVWVNDASHVVRCFDIKSGELLWQTATDGDLHFVALAWSEANKVLYGARWDSENGGPMSLCEIIDGRIHPRAPCDIDAMVDFTAGKYLISTEGHIIEMPSGRLLHQVVFPVLPPPPQQPKGKVQGPVGRPRGRR